MKANLPLIVAMVSLAAAAAPLPAADGATPPASPKALNLALVAAPATSNVSHHERLDAVNDGLDPASPENRGLIRYGNWPSKGTQWVEYTWSQPVSTSRSEVYWWQDGGGVKLPVACRLLYWDGAAFVPVKNAKGLGLAENAYNVTTFDEVTTTRLRMEMDGDGDASTGILEWKVLDSGKSPPFPPRVDAGQDRVVVMPGKT